MPTPPKKPNPAPAAAGMSAAESARQALSELLPRAIELLGSAPGCYGPELSGEMCVSLPLAGRQTLIGALRNRPNWYLVARKEIDKLARLVVERNWFARSIHEQRLNVYSHGFRFTTKEAREWAGKGTYPFVRYQKDMIEEWLVSRNLVVWWKKNPESGKLPALNVPNNGDVEFEVIGDVQQITLTFETKRNLAPEMEAKLGKRLFEAIKKGKKLVIAEGDLEFDFRVMKSGKSAAPGFPVSPIVTIFDDLDFIEAIRVGDWTGAKARWELIRQTKKGYAVTSGPSSGTPRNNAKPAELKAIVKKMAEIMGKLDMATNFDHDISYVTLPQEFFHPDLLAEVKQRLLMFGGVFAVMLLKTDSQIVGLGEFLMQMLRNEVLSFREEFSKLLFSIYQAESFRSGVPDAPELIPLWSVKPLYSAKALNELITTQATYGLAAPQTLRELLDIDNDAESARMLESHEEPKQFTPPFEPRQGISAGFVVPEPAGGNQTQQALPGEPGRPAA
jgi:hypothetical protein